MPSAVFVVDRCKSCGETVELECEGVSGVAGYLTHNEYFCPLCRKQNHALTAGAIVAARAGSRGAGQRIPVLARTD